MIWRALVSASSFLCGPRNGALELEGNFLGRGASLGAWLYLGIGDVALGPVVRLGRYWELLTGVGAISRNSSDEFA